jgi:hypothetical protein
VTGLRISAALKTLTSPRRAEFTKCLIAKRRQLAEEAVFASAATEGTWVYWLRVLRLPWLEFAFTPEATISRALEQFWDVVSRHYWRPIPLHLRSPIVESIAKAAPHELALLLRQVEWGLTKSKRADRALPKQLGLVSYIKHRIEQEHPIDPYPPGCGVTDQLIWYAIEESKLVFLR